MERPSIPKLVVTGAGAALLVTSVVGFAQATSDDEGDGGTAASGEITIRDFTFAPETTTVAPGATITWANEDEAVHTVTSRGGGPLDSGDIGSGAPFEHTFAEPGTYTYICSFHPNMQGTIEVTG